MANLARVSSHPFGHQLRGGSGATLPNCRVNALRWTGPGPAPDDPQLFTETVEYFSGKTGGDVVAHLVVPTWAYAAHASGSLTRGPPACLRIEAGTTAAVDRTMR